MTSPNNDRVLSEHEKSKLAFLEKEAGLVYQAIRDNLKLLINSLTIGISFSGASLITPLVDIDSGATTNTDIVNVLLNLFKVFPLFGYAILFYALFLINEIAYQSGYRRYLEEKIKALLYPPSISLWESNVFPLKKKDITNFLLFGVYWLFLVLLSAVVWQQASLPFLWWRVNLWWTVFLSSSVLGGISVAFTLSASKRAYAKLKSDEEKFRG